MRLRHLFEALTLRKELVIYSGSFSPWHLGHSAVYKYLNKKFPQADIFVASSSKKTVDRSFSFDDKKFLVSQAGIPEDKFVEVIAPYKANEITKNYDLNNTVLIFAISRKDKDRLARPNKKNGEAPYFLPYINSEECEPFSKHGYFIVVPTVKFSLLGKSINSAAQIREMYKNSNDRTRLKISKSLYPNSNKIQEIKDILDTILVSSTLIEYSGVVSDKVDDDGWILPNGEFIPNGYPTGYGGHSSTLYNYKIKSYDEAYDKGWVHFIIRDNNGILDTDNAEVEDNKNIDTFVRNRLKDFPYVTLTIWPKNDNERKTKKFEWNGRYFNQVNNTKVYESLDNYNTITNFGWLLPNGTFLEGWSHSKILRREGLKDYIDAYELGWLHFQFGNNYSRSGSIISSYGLFGTNQSLQVVQKTVKIGANRISKNIDNIYIQCSEGIFRYDRDYFTFKKVRNTVLESIITENENITKDGWFTPNGKFVENRFGSGHFGTLRNVGIDSYDEAFDLGWVHFSGTNNPHGVCNLQIGVSYSDNIEFINNIAKKLEHNFPIIKLIEKWYKVFNRYEWDGKDFRSVNRNKFNESVITENIKQDGWLLPSGQFIPNPYGSGHWDTLKKKGFKSYSDAWQRGWMHISFFNDSCIISAYSELEEMEPLLTKIAKQTEKVYPIIRVDCGSGRNYKKYEWTGKEFVPIKIKMFNESPDFNYSMFHNRDKELKNVKFNCVVTRNSGGGTYLEVMAMLDLEQIGYIHILYDKTAFNYSIGMVRRSDIEYEWKGTGLGQMLYDKAIHYAKEKGCKYLWSDTERSVNAENAWKRLSKRYPITFVTSKSGMKYYQVDLDKI